MYKICVWVFCSYSVHYFIYTLEILELLSAHFDYMGRNFYAIPFIFSILSCALLKLLWIYPHSSRANTETGKTIHFFLSINTYKLFALNQAFECSFFSFNEVLRLWLAFPNPIRCTKHQIKHRMWDAVHVYWKDDLNIFIENLLNPSCILWDF